jgi:hypothetical protein
MVHRKSSAAVVVGCSASAAGQAAVAVATMEAARRGLDLVLLAVPAGDDAAPARLRWPSQDATGSATQRAALVAEATDPHVPVSAVVLGPLDDVDIESLAARTALYVAPVRGFGADDGLLLLECPTDELLRRARCPVMIPHVTQPTRPWSTRRGGVSPVVRVVLAGVVGDRRVVAHGAREARIRRAAFWAVSTVPDGAGPRAVSDGLASAWLALRALPRSISPRVEVACGPLADVLVSRCNPDDLVVVGAQQLTGRPGRALLGDLVRTALHGGNLEDLPCDLLVVPVPAASSASDRHAASPSSALALTVG